MPDFTLRFHSDSFIVYITKPAISITDITEMLIMIFAEVLGVPHLFRCGTPMPDMVNYLGR